MLLLHCGCGLTCKCDPHGEGCAVNTEVLQDVISHEAQDGETWSITRMVDLQESYPIYSPTLIMKPNVITAGGKMFELKDMK